LSLPADDPRALQERAGCVYPALVALSVAIALLFLWPERTF
jgi:hypothetical protein